MDPQAHEPAVQDVPERPSLVAAMNCVGLGQLAVNKANKPLLPEPLRRLEGLLIDLPYHRNETGMYIPARV